MLFRDRTQAGRELAARLAPLSAQDPVVVGLPRGGVPVAAEVAAQLGAPLDVVVVRKLGVPRHPELAMGALGEGEVLVLNPKVVQAERVSQAQLDAVRSAEQAELDRRLALLRRGEPGIALAGRTVVVVDDGIATGATARAACQVARARGAARVVLAVPVGAPDALASLVEVADEVVSLHAPSRFQAVGQWYDDFAAVSDSEVVALLARARAGGPQPTRRIDLTARDAEVVVDTSDAALPGRLTVPADAPLTVVFAHGSGSSRHSPRNAYVASILNEAGLGTLLVDLLTASEGQSRANVFDIPLLARRVAEVTRWLRSSGLAGERVAYFGASTGAAAALWAAAEPETHPESVVSRGGRPDLALSRLAAVTAPTLLVVGGLDEEVLGLNQQALRHLGGPSRLAVVPGATHLFEEPGTLEAAAILARDWFLDHRGLEPAGVWRGLRRGRRR